MIYILVGGNTKEKNVYLKELTKNNENFFVREERMDRDLLMSYCYNVNLFDKSYHLPKITSQAFKMPALGYFICLKRARTRLWKATRPVNRNFREASS